MTHSSSSCEVSFSTCRTTFCLRCTISSSRSSSSHEIFLYTVVRSFSTSCTFPDSRYLQPYRVVVHRVTRSSCPTLSLQPAISCTAAPLSVWYHLFVISYLRGLVHLALLVSTCKAYPPRLFNTATSDFFMQSINEPYTTCQRLRLMFILLYYNELINTFIH